MKAAFEEIFQYICNIENIQADVDADGQKIDTMTVLQAHFIDDEAKKPVAKSVIQKLVLFIENNI